MRRDLMCIFLLAMLVVGTSERAQSTNTAAVRDKGAEDAVAKSLLKMLADHQLAKLSRYYPPLLSEGVCSSADKGAWGAMMETDGGPKAFYQTTQVGEPSDELRKLVEREEEQELRWRMRSSRFAVAVWKRRMADGSVHYWVGVVLAKSAISEWTGLHLGGDTPAEMISPNSAAKTAVIPECRNR